MNDLTRYRRNSQLFIRQKNWTKPARFYEKWEKVRKQKRLLDQYRDNPEAGGW
ncbi:hypothetical protein S21ZY_139 [Pseudomonas phage ZY21]|nr:hypothetical protein S21ZY_139 [Pseudomonas phage ZY21]